MHIVITGASRGIGLELTRQALANGDHVLAVARDPKGAKGLSELAQEFKDRLKLCAVDVASPEAPNVIVRAVDHWPAIDVLINNAGIYRKGENLEDFTASFHVNSVAPFYVTKTLLPKLRASKSPRAVQITSRMGSIDDNSSGASYAYRASKTALNMLNKCLAVENAWLTTIVMHPGWVKTAMGGSGAPTEIKDSAAGIWAVVRDLAPKNSGKFFDFKGETLPW